MSYRIADLLIRIKNAYLAGQKSLEVPYFKFGEELLKILAKEGFIKDVQRKKQDKKEAFKITLLYRRKNPALEDIEIVSKPGLRVYVKRNEIKKVMGGVGISVVSTSQGLMTGEKAKKKGLGGEFIAKIW